MAGKFNKKVKYQKKNFNIYIWRGKQNKFIETPKLTKKYQLESKIKTEKKSIFDDFFSFL